MTANVGGTDKKIRIAAGLILIVAGAFAPLSTGLRIGAFAVAAVALVTALVNF